MIKCKVFIYDDNGIINNDIFVDILLPAVPQINSSLRLTEELISEFENKIINSNKKNNFSLYFEKNKFKLNISIQISDIEYIANNEYVLIELNNDNFSLNF